jgi:hypothetical protein
MGYSTGEDKHADQHYQVDALHGWTLASRRGSDPEQYRGVHLQ